MDWLVKIDPTAYLSLVVIKRGVTVIYLNILCSIYGMLETSLLCYKKFRGDLEIIVLNSTILICALQIGW